MTNPGRNIKEINRLLLDTTKYLNKDVLDGLRSTVAQADKKAEPLKDYHDMFDEADRIDEGLPIIRAQLDETKKLVEELDKKIGEVISFIPELRTSYNENKMKFGLQGLAKQSLRKNMPKIDQMTESEYKAIQSPYPETPFERGGKTRRRRSKKSKTNKHRKSRKH